MKLLRYGIEGREKPGLLDSSGQIRDLSTVVPDIAGDVLSPAGLTHLTTLEVSSLPVVDSDTRLGPPVSGIRNFVCIGLNYADHAAETGAAIPNEPIVFLKSLSALSGPNDHICIPPFASKTDWEAELAVVIGTTAKCVPEGRAMLHVAGYTICTDLSEREWQLERGGTWDKGKGFDSFGPLGPWLVTADAVPNPHALDMFLEVDGHTKQQGSTRTMIFNISRIISYVSQCITLHPGDVISTGTPPGVGLGRKPQEFLRPGQIVRLGIEGLGEQLHKTILAN